VRLGAAIVLAALGAWPAAAHRIPPEDVVARLNSPEVRQHLGVERAVRDAKAPRLLVVRVGPRWYELPVEGRRKWAAEWLDTWRASVEGGIVAVLDAGTDVAVVDYGAEGTVASVVPTPPTPR
jgi:hypothetical protein